MADDGSPPGISEDTAILQAVLATAVDAIITIDVSGLIRHVNPAACRMFGYTCDELLGRNVRCLMPSPYCDEHDQYMRSYLATGQARIIGIGREVIGLRRDGTQIPIDLAVSESSYGEQRLFTGIIRDISELKSAQQRLIQSERLAAIGQMVTGLAHESRNALQRSRAFLDMLELDLEGRSEELTLVRQTQRALQELRELYEEVREYAAPIRLELASWDVVSLCLETWDRLADLHLARSIHLELVRSHDLPACLCDRRRVQQVARNIFDNAIAVAPERSQITLTATNTILNGEPAVRVAIRDQGPGLNDEQRAKIFEPFYTTKTRGTGLGMAIAHRVMDSHGGTIAVSETSKRGTEIEFTLLIDSGS